MWRALRWPFASSDPLVPILDYLADDFLGRRMMRFQGDSEGGVY